MKSKDLQVPELAGTARILIPREDVAIRISRRYLISMFRFLRICKKDMDPAKETAVHVMAVINTNQCTPERDVFHWEGSARDGQ